MSPVYVLVDVNTNEIFYNRTYSNLNVAKEDCAKLNEQGNKCKVYCFDVLFLNKSLIKWCIENNNACVYPAKV